MTAATARRVAGELARRLAARVETEQVQPGRFRFNVFSQHLGDVSRRTRQDQVWEVTDRVLSREESDDVPLVPTVGPEDVGAELASAMP